MAQRLTQKTVAKLFDAALAKAIARENAEIKYGTDSQGRKVRLPSTVRPVTRDEVRYCFLYNRAIELEEALEQVGPHIVRYWKEQGFVIPHGIRGSILLVTEKARDAYDLPAPHGGPFFKVEAA